MKIAELRALAIKMITKKEQKKYKKQVNCHIWKKLMSSITCLMSMNIALGFVTTVIIQGM